MKIENEFVVNAPVERAWETMLDLERIAPCLPGASIEEAAGSEYQGTMAIRLGSISARYRGTVSVVETDEDEHRAVLRASGKETRGQGAASATIVSTMSEENGATRIRVETDMQVAGKVAQFGRGIMQDVAAGLMERFSECVEREILSAKPDEVARTADEEGRAESSQEAPAPAGSEPRSPDDGVTPLDIGQAGRQVLLRHAAPLLAGALAVGLVALLRYYLRRPSLSIKFEVRRR